MAATANFLNVSPVVELAPIGNGRRSCQWNLAAEIEMR